MMLKKFNLVVGMLALAGMVMADVTLEADVNLTADADWSGQGTITVPAGIVVNLNGHRLVVDNVTGGGRIIDTASTYDLLDGITSTEGGNQWINTGVTPGATTAIAHDFTVDSAVDNRPFFGTGFETDVFLLVVQGASFHWYGNGSTIGGVEEGGRYMATVTTDKQVKVVKRDGTVVGTKTNMSLTNKKSNLNLFRGGSSSYYGVYTLHQSKIWQNNVLVRDFVPVRKRATGDIGLLDRVNMVFYANQSSTPFVYDDENILAGNDGVGEVCIKYADGVQVANGDLVVAGNVKMVLDLSTCTGSVAAPSAFWGTSVRVHLGARDPVLGAKLLDWMAIPEGVEFAWDPATVSAHPGVVPRLEFNGLYFGVDTASTVVRTARWTGAVDGDVEKPGNWNCFNASGAQLEDALPSEESEVYISGDVNLQIPVGKSLAYGQLSFDGCRLAADCDWRGLGRFPLNGQLDLNGHRLLVASLSGNGVVLSGYDRLDWIASCADRQRIDTGIVPGTDTEVEFDFATGDVYQENRVIFGAGWTTYCYLFCIQSTSLRFFGGGTTVCAFEPNRRLRITVDGNDRLTVYDAEGAKIGEESVTRSTSNSKTNTLKLFDLPELKLDNHYVTAFYRLYGFKIWKGGKLVRNFVPVRESSGARRVGLLDLVEYKFYGNAGASATGFIAGEATTVGTEDVGVLDVEVPEGETCVNGGVKLSGNVRFVKTGAGTYEINTAGAENTAGTVVSNGLYKVGAGAVDLGIGPSGTEIFVAHDGVFDANDSTGLLSANLFRLDGGRVVSTSTGVGSIGHLELLSDSSISNMAIIAVNRTATSADLGGCTLDIAGPLCEINTLTATNGTFRKVDGGILRIQSVAFNAATVNLDLDCALDIQVNGTVHDLTLRGGDFGATGTGALGVKGTFTPMGDNVRNFKLLDGSAIDLSRRTGVYAAFDEETALTFEGNIAVKLAGRGTPPVHGERLIAWKPQLVPATFVWDETTAATTAETPVATVRGLFYGGDLDSDEVVYAYWTGAAHNGNIADAANWTCSNALMQVVVDGLPCTNAAVFVSGEIDLNVPAGAELPNAMIEFGDCALTANCDWRGLTELPTKIDLHGHDLALAALPKSGEITDSSAFDLYDMLDYIESTAQQRITTDIVPGPGTAMDFEFTIPHYAADGGLFGTGYTWRKFLLTQQGNGLHFWGNNHVVLESLLENTRYRFSISASAIASMYDANGDQIGSNVGVVLTNDGNGKLKFFAPSDGQRGAYRFHACKLWQNGVLAGDFAPVRERLTGRCGLLDRVTGKFYVNDSGLGVDFIAGPVTTPGVVDAGTLLLDVPEGVTQVNSSVALTGALRLVKDGRGTFTMSKAGQSYAGGTVVAAGKIQAGIIGTSNPFGSYGGKIEVREATTLDTCAYTDFTGYSVVLSGGTLCNSSAQVSSYSSTRNGFGDITLTEDSIVGGMAKAGEVVFGGGRTVDLNGKTLTFVAPSGSFLTLGDPKGTTTLKNGKLDFSVVSWLVVASNATVHAETVDLDMSGAFHLNGDLSVRDYTARFGMNLNNGTGKLRVYGRFTPVHASYFRGCELQDGATIDLRAKSATWNTQSASANDNRVTFAEGAVITVDLTESPLLKTGKVVAWNEKPANEKGPTFRLEAGPRTHSYRLYTLDDGIWLENCATVIFFR